MDKFLFFPIINSPAIVHFVLFIRDVASSCRNMSSILTEASESRTKILLTFLHHLSISKETNLSFFCMAIRYLIAYTIRLTHTHTLTLDRSNTICRIFFCYPIDFLYCGGLPIRCSFRAVKVLLTFSHFVYISE